MWGTDDKQSHYRQGRKVTEIMLNDIDAVCSCGYITLKPSSDFERHNGGLTVKRSGVMIINNKTGDEVKRLNTKNKGIMSYGSCNACVNEWK